MIKIGIIGAGFSGTLTSVQLINKLNTPCEIILIDKKERLGKGVAYNPYSNKHLLNVITSKMSAFAHQPNHFLEWVMEKELFKTKDKNIIANSFLPRSVYGEYLEDVLKEAIKNAEQKQIKLNIINSSVVNLDVSENNVALELENKSKYEVDYCVIATGNNLPRNPKIKNMDFYNSDKYYQNPWKIESVKGANEDLPVLIIGNGLTMVDNVFGFIEQGFKGKIYSISPNGFNILPHRHGGLNYSKLIEELSTENSLYDLIKKVNKHIKMVREYGVSAEPIIDSLRPQTQKFWQMFSEKEKDIFMSRLRHLWGVARHRIPVHSHDKLQQLRINGILKIKSGKINNIENLGKHVLVSILIKKKIQLNQ
jgi:uncharacterized NAD(P)/FAD-binding protein YdhS